MLIIGRAVLVLVALVCVAAGCALGLIAGVGLWPR